MDFMRNVLGDRVWINPASSKGKHILGIVFAQGPGCTWWVIRGDGETQCVPGWESGFSEQPVMLNSIIFVVECYCMSQLPCPVMDCSRYTSQELLIQQPANSTPALMPWKTSRRDRIHSHGLNELSRHLGGIAMTTEIISVLCIFICLERCRIWA